MFDFANQAYTLLIVTVVFGDLFTRVIVGDHNDDYRLGNLLWSASLATSYFLVVLAGPICGAIMDYRAAKKLFLFASYVITVFTTAMLYYVEPGYIVLGMMLIIASNFAYAIGEAFVASFLPHLGRSEELGRISGFGWALGYVGGLMAAGLSLALLGDVSADNFDRIRWVGPLAGGFFLLAAIPTFLWLREPGQPQALPPGRGYLSVGFERIRGTLASLGSYRDLATLLVSVFFTMAGIYIVISFAFIYGAQVIGWDQSVRNYMFIVVQITAAAGALGFGTLQDRLGAKLIYLSTLILWIIAVAAIYLTPALTTWINELLGTRLEAQYVFLVMGSLAGLSLGSSQSAGRALVGILAPKSKAAELFGFWALAGRLAAVVGIVGIGLLQAWVGLHQAILYCIVLFFAAIVPCLLVNQERGQRVARGHEAHSV